MYKYKVYDHYTLEEGLSKGRDEKKNYNLAMSLIVSIKEGCIEW